LNPFDYVRKIIPKAEKKEIVKTPKIGFSVSINFYRCLGVKINSKDLWSRSQIGTARDEILKTF